MPNNSKGGPSSTRQRNAISDDGPTLNTGLVALWFFRGSVPVLLRKPFVISQGGPDPCPLTPSGSAHDFVYCVCMCLISLLCSCDSCSWCHSVLVCDLLLMLHWPYSHNNV